MRIPRIVLCLSLYCVSPGEGCLPGDKGRLVGFISDPGCTECGKDSPQTHLSSDQAKNFWRSILTRVLGFIGREECDENGWGIWSEFTPCSTSCGGVRRRTRHCTKTAGFCQGKGIEVQPCKALTCQEHSAEPSEEMVEWEGWGDWSPCHLTCGHGVRVRQRECPKNGLCSEGSSREEEACIERECPVQGIWMSWSPFSPCSTMCGSGIRTRSRGCRGAFHGGFCAGEEAEEQVCNVQPCSMDGHFTAWSEFGACSVSCGSDGLQKRLRQCFPPQNGGRPCQGLAEEDRPCPNVPTCPVMSQWGNWRPVSDCSVGCGGGMETQMRECINQNPSHREPSCSGSAQRQVSCNEEQCSGPLLIHITDALNNRAMVGAIIHYRIGGVSGQIRHGITDEDGKIIIEGLPLGHQISLDVENEGYVSLRDIVIWCNSTTSGNRVISLSKELSFSDSKRVVLNWGSLPVDMDLRVSQINPETRRVQCVVSYNSKNCANVALDIDVLTGDKGAETITWHQTDNFQYALIIKDYTLNAQIPLTHSEAKVTLYGHGTNTITLEVPKDESFIGARYWIVGCLNGSKGIGSFVEINHLTREDPQRNAQVCFTSTNVLR